MKSGVAKYLGVAGIQQQNGLVVETNVTLFAKVVLYRNMGFNESVEYKKTFIGSGVGAIVEKIYEHEPLAFNNIVACEIIFKWKAGLKDDMDARSDVYAEIWATKGLLDKAKGNVLGMEIVRDKSGNTLRVSQSRFYNGKLVQNLLEGYSILSLKGSLSGDCDVEKNESGYELRLVAGTATGALVKGYSRSEVPA
uniref:Zinc finger, CCHC-type n=1 Tax=Tanacetum cinerariifolium TaxID=118510 RepID=A0A6L2NK97_TANCI|nr:zinc finger, CCHC-type [Tanacetum cinerariifolium]